MEEIKKLINENKIDGVGYRTINSADGSLIVILSTPHCNYGGRRWQEVARLLAEDIKNGRYAQKGR